MKLKSILALLGLLCLPLALAQADLSSVAQGVQSAPSLSLDQLLSTAIQITAQVKGSVPLGLKLAGLVLLVIALMKVSFLQPMWDKLGKAQAALAPVLGLALGLLLYGAGGGALTIPTVLAYLGSGGGAIMLHELLDVIKSIPGLGTGYVSAISAVESVLGGGS